MWEDAEEYHLHVITRFHISIVFGLTATTSLSSSFSTTATLFPLLGTWKMGSTVVVDINQWGILNRTHEFGERKEEGRKNFTKLFYFIILFLNEFFFKIFVSKFKSIVFRESSKNHLGWVSVVWSSEHALRERDCECGLWERLLEEPLSSCRKVLEKTWVGRRRRKHSHFHWHSFQYVQVAVRQEAIFMGGNENPSAFLEVRALGMSNQATNYDVWIRFFFLSFQCLG